MMAKADGYPQIEAIRNPIFTSSCHFEPVGFNHVILLRQQWQREPTGVTIVTEAHLPFFFMLMDFVRGLTGHAPDFC